MLRTLEYLLLAIFAAIIIVVSYWISQQSYAWMPVQASTDANRIDDLFSFLVWLGAIIFLGVTGTILYSIVAFRASKEDFSEGHPARHNWKIELTWTAIPVVLVLWIAGYGFNIYAQMDVAGPTQILGELPAPMKVKPASAEAGTLRNQVGQSITPLVTVEVIAKQWAWSFRYPNRNVVSPELHLPVNQHVRLVLKSEDVLHGFYVPEFRIKQDIIPNRPINFQFVPTRLGQYRLHDSQFSGTYFALMQTNVYVDTPQTYNQWLNQATTQKSSISLNKAASEHAQPPRIVFRSNWPTVPPA